MPTATSSMNVTPNASSMAKPGTSKNTSSEVDNEQCQAKTETNVPIVNSSNDNASSTLSGRNDTESSEQEMLRRRRLQKFST